MPRVLWRAARFVDAGIVALLATGCDRAITEPDVPVTQLSASVVVSPLEELGDLIFDDPALSINRNQSCASCHDREWGGTGPIPAINIGGAVYEGSITGRFGDRKPPTHMYATTSPVFTRDRKGLFVGGSFWDGRATGLRLGSAAAEQAQGPFLNPMEQALPDAACVVYRVSVAPYASLYQAVFGGDIGTIAFPGDTDALCGVEGATVPLSVADRAQVNEEYDNIAYAIAAYEGSPLASPYTSKFDAWRAGAATLTQDEVKGWALFNGKGKCADCHVPRGPKPAFTDFSYDNLGVPKNPANPFYARNPAFVDPGLGGFLLANPSFGSYAPEMGKMKVPTLRNVDRRPTAGAVKAYMHNGVFKSLLDVVHFYNTRDVLPSCLTVASPVQGQNCWYPPEVEANVNRLELGNLGLTAAEERAIVAFLKTLSDGYLTP